MSSINFKELCNSIKDDACVVSVEKVVGGYGEIRIVDGNEPYIASFKQSYYSSHEFIPGKLYTEYLERNLNFEEYCYRSSVKKELLHSYAYPEYFKSWMHMLFVPLAYETEKVSYCLYIMEINDTFNPELLANPSGDVYSKVLNTTLQLAETEDFDQSLKNVAAEIRKLCNALFCCILIVDEVNRKLAILGQDRDETSKRLAMEDYMDPTFYDLVQSWDATIANSNCIIVKDEAGMDYIKEKNPEWYASLSSIHVNSLVLFRLKTGNKQIGYMWVSDFQADDTPKIKEALEITTFVLGAQIGNHLLLDQLTKLSSVDLLTGLYNRNKLNAYMTGIAESESKSIGLIFLDINGLKQINDQEGHLAGDDLIKRAAKSLNAAFPDNDVFRVGGDEFVIILKDVDEEEIIKHLDVLHQKAAENNVSFAAGYSMTSNPHEIEKILKEADFNMYEDKRKFYKR